MSAETGVFMAGLLTGAIMGAPVGAFFMTLFINSGRLSRREEEQEWKERTVEARKG